MKKLFIRKYLKFYISALVSCFVQLSFAQDIINPENSLYVNHKKQNIDNTSTFNFELNKYLGLWYEQAHLPTFFQKGCDSSTAQYSLNENGTVKVLNTCYKLDGSSNDIVGKAKVDLNDTSGRGLIVSFNIITDIINFFKGVNYYIYYIDESYNYAIVGTPKKDMLWILTRDKSISSEKLEELIYLSQKNGFNISKIIYDKRNN